MSEFKKPERYLGAYTPNKYKSDQPPYINVMQVGSMVRVTVRGDSGDMAVFVVNAWEFDKFSKMFAAAKSQFDMWLPEFVPLAAIAAAKESP